MDAFREFAEIEAVLGHFRPLTPYGRAKKEEREFFSSEPALDAEYGLIDAGLAFIRRSPSAADRAEFHLKNIPALERGADFRPDITDILLCKKLLHHVRGLCAVVPPAFKKAVGFEWKSPRLYDRLGLGGGGETFYLADAYCPGLKKLRGEIRALDLGLEKERLAECSALKKKLGLDFGARQFLLLPDGHPACKEHGWLLFLERYDSSTMTAKPVHGGEFLSLSARREQLVREEKRLESSVLRDLASALNAESAVLAAYIRSVEKLDCALAKARMALSLKLSKPLFLSSGKAIAVRGGRLLPLEAALAAKGLKYTPLSFDFTGGRVAVVSGSNMGGKTVVLKTLAQLQLLAQCGFFVPADAFRTVLFKGVYYAGYGVQAQTGGLSSFGLELHSFMQSYAVKERPCLFLLDEFARTTNSEEASALLSAIIEAFSSDSGIYAFIATHFSGLRAAKGSAFYRMLGLDGAALAKRMRGPRRDLAGALKTINQHMRYQLRRDAGKTKIYDALKIAQILGFDGRITSRALKIMEETHES
ncbi:MAG: hypothetical protein GX410_02130 [Elusimicrobia bacterium]|nr:hypothetical protein [Elusimicrobiota bacterium]